MCNRCEPLGWDEAEALLESYRGPGEVRVAERSAVAAGEREPDRLPGLAEAGRSERSAHVRGAARCTGSAGQGAVRRREADGLSGLGGAGRSERPAHAFPGSLVPLFVWDGAARVLELRELMWGFEGGQERRLVFNTRLETALEQSRTGRGMWAGPIHHGRCLVPVRAFYETHATQRVASPRTGRAVRCPYRFTVPCSGVFLMAGVSAGGRFSVVTTLPNGAVAPVHDRMPLVLGPGESADWLVGSPSALAALADRSRIHLEAATAMP